MVSFFFPFCCLAVLQHLLLLFLLLCTPSTSELSSVSAGSSSAGQIIISLPARIQRHIQTLNFKPPLTMALSDNRHMPIPRPPRLALRAQKRHGYPKKPSTVSARQKKAKRCDKITFSSIKFDLVALKIMKNLTGAKSQL